MTDMTAQGHGSGVSRANLALGASLLAVGVWITAGAANEDLYTLMPIPALAGLVLGVRARRNGSDARRALAAAVIGGLLAALWAVYFVAYLAGWV